MLVYSVCMNMFAIKLEFLVGTTGHIKGTGNANENPTTVFYLYLSVYLFLIIYDSVI